ncbi:MAG: hypothetical protein HeimC2_41320 [Candidatus Heimdallarchaeota archaeon LC_2]|nr:MAG: hypothetical protein HeimC2_41320 [Candidatus Heimdallarchaeota archaeon LC_2]
MPKVLLIDNDEDFQNKLRKGFEDYDNEFDFALPGDAGLTKYKDYIPDLVLINYCHCKKDAKMMFDQILRFDSTACIIVLLNDDEKNLISEMYKYGARSTISSPKKLKTDKDTKIIMDQMFEVCAELKFEECVGCWKTQRFSSTIKFN